MQLSLAFQTSPTYFTLDQLAEVFGKQLMVDELGKISLMGFLVVVLELFQFQKAILTLSMLVEEKKQCVEMYRLVMEFGKV